MPRKQAARPSPARSSRTNGAVISVAPYARDARWATPLSRRRTDVFVVSVTDRFTSRPNSSEDPLALTA
jgi:hypothetical protein